MAQARTTSVDSRMVIHLTQAIPPELPDEVIKAHLKQAELSHNLIRELLRTDPAQIDFEAFMQAIRGTRVSLEVKTFVDRDILDRVRALGGQFAQARLTHVVGGETLESQRRNKVIQFWSDWHWKLPKGQRLEVSPSIASEVVYLTDVVEGSLNCTFDSVEGRQSVEEVLASLPKVEGLRWIVGNTPTTTRVLANHLKATGDHLLPYRYTWTTDVWESPEHGRDRLFVGYFHSGGLDVHYLPPRYSVGHVGLFVLGVPEE